MYQQRPPFYYAQGYPHVIDTRPRMSTKEMLWRISWPYILTIVLASLMLLFTIIIFILEIASLAVDSSNNLSNTASTGAGIWCSIFFLIPIVLMYLLGNLQLVFNKKNICCFFFQYLVCNFDSSRIWSTYTLIANLIAMAIICILIGLDANAVTPYNTMVTTAPTKIKILRGQLALAILMLLFPIGFFAAYIYTAFISLFPLRPHTHSVNSPFPIPSNFVHY